MSVAGGGIRFDLDQFEEGLPWIRDLNTATARGLNELRENGDPDYFRDAIEILESDASDYFGVSEDVSVADYMSPNSGHLVEQYRIFCEVLEDGREVVPEMVEQAEGIYRALTDIEVQKRYSEFSDW